MAKIMIFVDGTWLYSNTPRLSEIYGDPNFHVDFGKMPQVIAREVGKYLGTIEVDVVRTYLFGSIAANYDLRDEEPVSRRGEFFDILKEEFHYEVEIYPINFMGRRLRKSDRDPHDTFEPKEKCVDIALATTMLYLAAIPYAYDIAIAIIGDRDFMPMLQNVRRLGKRVAIASIKGSCAPEFADPRDEARVKDFDIIWLDNLLHELEFKYERERRKCESPIHKGDPLVWTTFRPRKGQQFFCDDCRGEFRRRKQEAQQQFVSTKADVIEETQIEANSVFETDLVGTITKIISNKQYGFIRTETGENYFFHLTDLIGLKFEDLREGLPVIFGVKKKPSEDKAGAAENVHSPVEE